MPQGAIRKMKQKISVTIDEETVLDILDSIRTGKFRNKSHVVEFAVKKLLEDEMQDTTNKNNQEMGYNIIEN